MRPYLNGTASIYIADSMTTAAAVAEQLERVAQKLRELPPDHALNCYAVHSHGYVEQIPRGATFSLVDDEGLLAGVADDDLSNNSGVGLRRAASAGGADGTIGGEAIKLVFNLGPRGG